MTIYQIRLDKDQDLASLLSALARAAADAARRLPAFAAIGEREIAALERELRGVLLVFVRSYDSCGGQAICEEGLNPAAWNRKPDPSLSERRPWEAEDIRRFRLEVNRDLGEFSSALAAAAMRALIHDPKQAEQSHEFRKSIEEVVVGLIGPHLYENPACGQCELCRDARTVDAWN